MLTIMEELWKWNFSYFEMEKNSSNFTSTARINVRSSCVLVAKFAQALEIRAVKILIFAIPYQNWYFYLQLWRLVTQETLKILKPKLIEKLCTLMKGFERKLVDFAISSVLPLWNNAFCIINRPCSGSIRNFNWWVRKFTMQSSSQRSKDRKYLHNLSNYCWIFIDSFSKINGFENLPLKIDGFSRAHANGATALLNQKCICFFMIDRSEVMGVGLLFASY